MRFLPLLLILGWGFSVSAQLEQVDAPPARFHLISPTLQTRLDGSVVTNVFMHAGGGNPESGMFGFGRNASDGLPRFHEGIDIAPLKRSRQGIPLDSVKAAADGTVAYVNRKPGNSSYGCYVVLLHSAPNLGTIYTLYSHLASVKTGIAPGGKIARGTELGRMGNTPGFPMARAHLHFECGLIGSTRFAQWFRMDSAREAAKTKTKNGKLKPDHGSYNGQNLMGMNPSDLYRLRDEDCAVDVLRYLKTLPVAFSVVCEARRHPDYFKRYPALWGGAGPFRPGLIKLDISQEGIVLRGQNIDGERPGVLAVNTSLPGTRGRRLIARTSRGWVWTQSGLKWLEAFLF